MTTFFYRTVCVLLCLTCIGLLIAADTYALDITDPIYKYPDTVSILFLPFVTPDSNFLMPNDFRNMVIKSLTEKGDFNYIFRIPEYDESRLIYKYGFAEKDIRQKLTQIYPRHEYWKNTDVQYIVFGCYDMGRKDMVVVEFHLYSVRNDELLVGKKYTFDRDEISTLCDKVVIEIVNSLKKYHISNPPAKKK